MAFVVDDHVRQLAFAQKILVEHLREVRACGARQVAPAPRAGDDHGDPTLLADDPQRSLVHPAVAGVAHLRDAAGSFVCFLSRPC